MYVGEDANLAGRRWCRKATRPPSTIRVRTSLLGDCAARN